MAIEHKNLTGVELHEPKGADAAADGTVYVADGAGSGAWVNIFTDIINLNLYSLTSTLTDLATASSVYFYAPVKSRIRSVHVIIYGAVDADTLISPFLNGVAVADTFTIAAAGSAAGQATSRTFVSTTNMAAGSIVRIDTNGAAAGAVRADVQVVFEAIP